MEGGALGGAGGGPAGFFGCPAAVGVLIDELR